MNEVLVANRSVVDMAIASIQGKVLQESGAYVIDEAGSKVAYMMEAPALSEAHKRRIVAAVNACAGISLEELRALGVGGLATLLERVRGGGSEEGADAVGVVEEVASQPSHGGGRRDGEVSIHVVAWRYSGGAGFHWYADQAEADAAFAEESRLCAEMRDRLWVAYRFEVQVGALLMKDEITALISKQIDALCASRQPQAAGTGMKANVNAAAALTG